MQTSGHNIANANTEGFSRQRAESSALPPIGVGNVVLGTGSTIKAVRRMHDQLVENRLSDNLTEHKYYDERSFQLGLIENVYNESNSEGLSTVMNKFFNSFRELANQPEDETVRSIVRENAKVVINDIHTIRKSLETIEKNIDQKVTSIVDDINTIIKNIGKTNIEIAKLEAMNGETGDLRDQRDAGIRTLSEFFNVKSYSDNKGQFVISAEGVGTLLVANNVQELMVGADHFKGSVDDYSGGINIYFKNNPNIPLLEGFKKGTLGASFETKSSEIKDLKEHIDTVAYEFTNIVNAIHSKGFTNKKVPLDQNGNPDISKAPKGATGIDFFKVPPSKHRAAEYIELSDDIKKDAANIATALTPNSPGDNRIALAISKLQHEKILDNGNATTEEFFLAGIGKIGTLSAKARLDTEHSAGILAQSEAVKERISGVSIDEETANMIKFQHAYDASARVMKTASAMFNTILGIMS